MLTEYSIKIKTKEDCSYQGKTLSVPTALKNLWSAYNMKMYKNQNEKNLYMYIKIQIFCKNHLPTRHIKYKVILFLVLTQLRPIGFLQLICNYF